jgi:hypothetical protein
MDSHFPQVCESHKCVEVKLMTDSLKECRTCVWWAHQKVAKAGECTRQAGIIVSHPTTGTRTAYPRTVSDESCDKYREKN